MKGEKGQGGRERGERERKGRERGRKKGEIERKRGGSVNLNFCRNKFEGNQLPPKRHLIKLFLSIIYNFKL